MSKARIILDLQSIFKDHRRLCYFFVDTIRFKTVKDVIECVKVKFNIKESIYFSENGVYLPDFDMVDSLICSTGTIEVNQINNDESVSISNNVNKIEENEACSNRSCETNSVDGVEKLKKSKKSKRKHSIDNNNDNKNVTSFDNINESELSINNTSRLSCDETIYVEEKLKKSKKSKRKHSVENNNNKYDSSVDNINESELSSKIIDEDNYVNTIKEKSKKLKRNFKDDNDFPLKKKCKGNNENLNDFTAENNSFKSDITIIDNDLTTSENGRSKRKKTKYHSLSSLEDNDVTVIVSTQNEHSNHVKNNTVTASPINQDNNNLNNKNNDSKISSNSHDKTDSNNIKTTSQNKSHIKENDTVKLIRLDNINESDNNTSRLSCDETISVEEKLKKSKTHLPCKTNMNDNINRNSCKRSFKKLSYYNSGIGNILNLLKSEESVVPNNTVVPSNSVLTQQPYEIPKTKRKRIRKRKNKILNNNCATNVINDNTNIQCYVDSKIVKKHIRFDSDDDDVGEDEVKEVDGNSSVNVTDVCTMSKSNQDNKSERLTETRSDYSSSESSNDDNFIQSIYHLPYRNVSLNSTSEQLEDKTVPSEVSPVNDPLTNTSNIQDGNKEVIPIHMDESTVTIRNNDCENKINETTHNDNIPNSSWTEELIKLQQFAQSNLSTGSFDFCRAKKLIRSSKAVTVDHTVTTDNVNNSQTHNLNVNDIVKFKVLVLSENYVPSVSNFVTGRVNSVTDDKIKLEILDGKDVCKPLKGGKFYLDDDIDDEKEGNNNTMELSIKDLIMPTKVNSDS